LVIRHVARNLAGSLAFVLVSAAFGALLAVGIGLGVVGSGDDWVYAALFSAGLGLIPGAAVGLMAWFVRKDVFSLVLTVPSFLLTVLAIVLFLVMVSQND
jgi:hypothetical protein